MEMRGGDGERIDLLIAFLYRSPVAIKVSGLKTSVEKALSSTFVKLNNGINT